MTEYLITDIRTGEKTWVAGGSAREALITHENGWRTVALPANSKASYYSHGNILDVSLGESSCRGLLRDVVREG